MKSGYKSVFIIAVAIGLVSANADRSWAGAPAGPTASVSGVVNGGNIDWTVFFTPDENLFSDNPPRGVGGSLAVEFSFEVANGTLLPGTVDHHPDFLQVIMGTPIINPGNDPYAGGIVFGTQTYNNVPSQLGGSENIDAIFAPLGSNYFTTGGPKEALTFSTTGTAGTVTFGGIIAQESMLFTLPPATATAIPEPATMVLALLGSAGLVGLARYRLAA
jgi:hypothetical protein